LTFILLNCSFGPGAGAASAGLLAIMPRCKSMVRRVIAMSGSPLADWAAINDKFRAMNNSLVFGERVGCTIDNSWKLVDCIRRGRSFAELTNVEFKPEIGTWPWAPIVQVG
jgi:neuroligin